MEIYKHCLYELVDNGDGTGILFAKVNPKYGNHFHDETRRALVNWEHEEWLLDVTTIEQSGRVARARLIKS